MPQALLALLPAASAAGGAGAAAGGAAAGAGAAAAGAGAAGAGAAGAGAAGAAADAGATGAAAAGGAASAGGAAGGAGAAAGGAGLFSSIPGAGSYGKAQGLSDIGGVSEAFSSILGGIQTNKADSRVSGQEQRLASQAALSANTQINVEDTQANRVLGAARAGAAASGVTQGGSARVVNNASVTQENLRDSYTRYMGALSSSADLYAAANARYQGKVAETAGFLKGGSSLITAGMQ